MTNDIDTYKLPAPFEGLQLNIAELLEKGEDASNIALKCGCSVYHVYGVLKSAKFQDWQRGLAYSELHGIGAKVAISTLIEIARDKKAGKQARVSASDKLLHYTGYSVSEDGRLEKSPSAMTAAELQERLNTLHNEAINRSKTVIEGEIVQETIIDLDNLLS